MPKSVSGATPPRSTWQPVLSVASLPRHEPRAISLVPDRDHLAALARDLGLSALRKVALRGTLAPLGTSDWQLDAMLGATVVQPCGVTLAPVTTRIDERVERIWRAEPTPLPGADTGEAEIEMPEDVREEPLGRVIDLGAVLAEALALAVPDWPRAPDAELGDAVFAAPGIRPLRDEDTRPFAGLAGLRDRLEAGTDDDADDSSDDNSNDSGDDRT